MIVPTSEFLGSRIRMARLQARLSQRELGEKLDPTRSGVAISYIESGISRAFFVDVFKIAEITGQPIEFFMNAEVHARIQTP